MKDIKKKGTIYQELNGLFNMGGADINFNKEDNNTTTTNQNNVDNKIVIKGNSPEEIHRKGLELEQKNELKKKFFNTTDRGFQKALQYEAARLPAYIDYEGMEYYPIISSALDLFMEESTTIGLNGNMLNIFSSKERIKSVLDEFFYDIVNVNVNLPFWTRNVVKYGDNFVLLYGERKTGISHVKQMVNYEIERFERIQNGKPVVKFKERMTGDEFNSFEVAHFRLLGDDKYLPYGSSVLNKIRRVFRQLVMAEDAMLTYRIVRAGEKKVFKIDVGNIDDDDIEDYIYKVATKFKKMASVSPNDGQIDYRFNILGNDEDYFIPVRNQNVETGIDTLPGACLSLETEIDLLDGRSLKLSDVIKEYNSGNELWSYSINPNTGNIVPGQISWAGVTRKETQVLKLTLDNGKSIIVTPDHKFPTKFNGIKEAQNLNIGESLWAFNKQFKQIRNSNNEYEIIYDHYLNDWVYTHRMVDNFFNDEIKNGIVRHHIDLNRFNDNPNNIKRMTSREHFKLHGEQTIKYNEKLLDLLIDYYSEYDRIDLILENKINIENSEWLNEFNLLNSSNKQLKKMNKITRNNIDKLLKYFGYSNWRDFKNKIPYYNHKIVSIEWLSDKQDTGTITIDGHEKIHNFHNFALSCGVFTQNSNLDQIQDIEYLRDNLFMGLGIPKPFLSFQDAAGGGKNLAQFDIRFAKKINRIQQAMIQELNKMAMIHLYLLGYNGEDLTNFTLTLTNPSTQQELLKSELLRDKAQTYAELTRGEGGIAAMSHTTAKRLVFNWTDKEIVDDLKKQKMEKAVMQELQDSPTIIKQTGLFKDIDDLYGEPVEGMPIDGQTGDTNQDNMETKPPEPPESGMEDSIPPSSPDVSGGIPPLSEYGFNRLVKDIVYDNKDNDISYSEKKIIRENENRNNNLNVNAQNMIIEIDKLLKNGDTIHHKYNDDNIEDIELDDIDELE